MRMQAGRAKRTTAFPTDMFPGLGTRRGNDLAVFALVGAAYLSVALNPRHLESAGRVVAFAGVGLAYLIAGTTGFAATERAGGVGAAVAYLAAQGTLTAGAVALSGGDENLILLVLPLVAQCVRLLPVRGVFAVCVLVATGSTLATVPDVGWAEALRGGLVGGVAIVFLVAYMQVAVSEERARAEADRLALALRAANAQLRAHAAQVESLAAERERVRLAREMHDGVGHLLTTVAVQVQAAGAILDADPARARDLLTKAHALVGDALGEVRTSVAALREDTGGWQPLPGGLDALVRETVGTGLAASLVVRGVPRPIAPAAHLTLYRAAQEGLTNAHKHARARAVALTLDYTDDAAVRLVVRDDGIGAESGEIGASADTGGFGLLGLRERAQLLGGRVTVDAAPGQGFALAVEVPG